MIEVINPILDRLSPKDVQMLGFTWNKYDYPVKPRDGEKVRFWKNKVSHVGNLKHALDFIIRDPRVHPMPIFAPADGLIIQVIQEHDKFGDSSLYAMYTNHIVISTGYGEIVRIAHIAKNSSLYNEGSFVKRGKRIATTGTNGWMSDVRHCHFEVGNVVSEEYRTLRVRWSGN